MGSSGLKREVHLFVLCQCPSGVPWQAPAWLSHLAAQCSAAKLLTMEVLPLDLSDVQVVTPGEEALWGERGGACLDKLVGVAIDSCTIPLGAWAAVRMAGQGCRVFLCGPGALPGMEVVEELAEQHGIWVEREKEIDPACVPPWEGITISGNRGVIQLVPAAWRERERPREATAVVGECAALWRGGVREVIVAGMGVPAWWWGELAEAFRSAPVQGLWGVHGDLKSLAEIISSLARGGCGRVFPTVAPCETISAAEEAVAAIQRELPIGGVICQPRGATWSAREEEGALSLGLVLGGRGCPVVMASLPGQWDPGRVRATIAEKRRGWIFVSSSTSPSPGVQDRVRELSLELGWRAANTFGTNLLAAVDKQPDRVFLKGVRSGGEVWEETVGELWRETELLAAGLLALGVRKGDFLFFARCRVPAGIPLLLAALAIGAVVMSYPRIVLESVEDILHKTEPALGVWDEAAMAVGNGRGIVLTGAGTESLEPLAALRERGRLWLARHPEGVRQAMAAVDPTDPAALMFSSGSTRPSSSILLPHGYFFEEGPSRSLRWTILTSLSFCTHAGLLFLKGCLQQGMTFAVWDPARSQEENCRLLCPDLVHLPVDVYQELFQQVKGTAREPDIPMRLLWDWFGPKLKGFLGAGAPVPLEVEEAFTRWGIPLFRGYGLVETGQVSSAFNGFKVGTVGRLTPGTRVRFAADGEILVKRPHMMLEYWRDPAATQAAFREDGWFATGDLGRLDEEGFLVLLGRKKEVIIPSQQGRIFPQVIEGAILADPAFAQVMVYGEGRPYLVALVVPAEGEVVLGDGEAVERWYLERARAALRRLPAEYQVRRLAVLPARWSVEGGELTEDHQKLRRHVIAAKYRSIIEALYQEVISSHVGTPPPPSA